MISIVICSITPAKYQAVCANLGGLLGDEPHEFVGIHDARSMAEGFNRGIRALRGEIIICCHDDIEILAPDFAAIFKRRLARFDLIGVAGANRFAGPQWVHAGPPCLFGHVAHLAQKGPGYQLVVWGAPARAIDKIRVMDGMFLAGRREVFEKIDFDEQTFRGFHLYDIDFTLRASAAGYRLGVCTDFAVLHHSLGQPNAQWHADAHHCMIKHAALIEPRATDQWQVTTYILRRKEELLPALLSPYWKDE